MVKTSHNKTIRINASGDYQINSGNEFIIIDTTGNVKIHFPHMLKDNDRVNIIAVVATPDVACKDGAGSEFANLTTDYGYMQVEYNTSADAYIFRELVEPPVTPTDTGWTLTPGVTTTLNSAIGLNLGSVSNTADSLNPYSVIDTSTIDVQSSIEDLEIEGQIKIYKAQGANNIILDSLSGFSDGTQTLTIVDSAIIFFDGSIWQILYNNEWKTKVVDIPMGVAGVSGILGMGSNPVELLPAPGVGKYYEVETIITKYTHDTTAYSTFAILAFLFGGTNFYNTIDSMITVASNSIAISKNLYSIAILLNQNLVITTSDSSDPTLGDGTLQVIIKYRVLTF